ncbi:hypothetical protein [Methylobrevis pamukkalensis]|uniref:Uncharacterized protein n=1 Tax=Methylobrevis pamukkalensis TaxID=1439726 RepID=A0A1E3H8C0_9HYPH|nr:hypothetical protein [Methylobrevis pamukkalensis]ODN72579.1 hypothetical protein A6302_00070 [Methylobrevis pamukkalensis]
MTPLTISELNARRMRLAIYCTSCGRQRYLRGPFPEAAVIADLAAGMTCTRCRSREVEARAIDRDARTGFWPAEAG